MDNKEENIKNEFLNMLIRLIYKIQNDFKIDSNRIYGTGQSIGADTIIDLLKNNSNVFSSIIITNGININKEIISKFNKSFIYFASEENLNCFNIQIDIKNYLNTKNIKYGSIINVNPLEKVQILNQIFKEMFIKNYTFNFVTFSKRKDFNYKNKNNDIETYKYSYRTEVVRDWLFSQNMIKCDDNYYYSEEFGKCFSVNKKKVYLIKYNKETDMLYNLLKNASFISKIKIGSPDIIPLMTTDFLKEYDCIIYDFYDTSYLINTDKKDEIKSYIKSGGSFLVTHDKWDSDKGPLELIGLKYNHNDTEIEISSSKRAKVSRYGHSLFDCYHDLTDWRIIDIRKTHKSHHIIKNDIKNTARVIMEFEKDIETGIKYDYLTVNEIGKGRIAYWAAGHHDDITEDEQKLFINIVSWLTKIKQ